MKKTTKIWSVLSIYFFLLIIDGCVNCKCPNNILEFFDFQKFEQNVNSTSLSEFEDLEITMSFDSISYLAQVEKKPCWNIGLMNTATACSCNDQGEGGLKFPISQIKISSNQDISPDLLSGTSLDSIFYIVELSDGDNNQIPKSLLVDYNLSTSNWFNYEGEKFQFHSVGSVGELGVPHIFKIEFTKSNGEIISAETPPIIWN